MFELDHVIVFVARDAPEAKALEALGLRGFGGVTHHGDLGTASTSFFFENAYLELFWVHDASQLAQHLGSLGHDPRERMAWRETGASPFALALRRRPGVTAPLPFAVTSLRASWMPGEVLIEFMTPAVAEPLYSLIPVPLQYPTWRHNIPEPHHPLGVKALSGVHVAVTGGAPSPVAARVAQAGIAAVEPGSEPLMTLTFDGEAQGRTVDARPALPLVLRC